MIPRLYAAGTSDFRGEGLGALAEASSGISEAAVNGVPTITLTYPTSGRHAAEITERCVIVADQDRRKRAQPYIIKAIDKSTPGVMQIYAEHRTVELLDGIGLEPYTAPNLTSALSAMTAHATDPLPVSISAQFNSAATFRHAVPSSVKRALGGMDGSIIDTYGGEWDFDVLTAILAPRIGADNGVVIRAGKNLTNLRMTLDWSGVYTGIYPYWRNTQTGDVVQLDGDPVYSLGSFNFVRVLVLDAAENFQTQPTPAELLAYVTSYAATHTLTAPRVSWDVQFRELRRASMFEDVALLEEVALGDTVTIYLRAFGANASSRVISERYDFIREIYEELQIGSVRASLAGTIQAQSEAIARQRADLATAEGDLYTAIQNATQQITGNLGGYVVMKTGSDGKPQEILVMDTDDVTTATKVWRWNQSGLGYSATGYNGPYTTAITQDGSIVADFITTGSLNASLSTTGTLAANMVTAAQLVAGTIQSADGQTFVLNLNTGVLSIDGTNGGGVNLKNCGISVQKSQVYAASSYAASDTTRVQQIILGNISPTEADCAKYDFYGDGAITITDLLLTQQLANGSTNLTVTWYAQFDTTKTAIIRVWRQNSGANTGTQEIFRASTSGVQMLDMTPATAISAAPSDTQPRAYDVTIAASFSAGGITFPQYAKGRYVATGGDAVLWVVGVDGYAYVAFRNNGTWSSGHVLQPSTIAKTTISQHVTAGQTVNFDLANGETAFLGFVADTGVGAVDIGMQVNGGTPTNNSYTYAGSASNYASNILARSGSGTFTGWISCHGGVVEVWGSGRRGTENVRGDTLLTWAASSVSNVAISQPGTLTITKIA